MAFPTGKQLKSRITGEFYEKDFFYFTDFPKINYDFDNGDKSVAIRNFLKRFSFRKRIKNNAAVYSFWIVRDEDSPEIIAHKLYDSPHYYWIILILNQILDPLFDWPLTDRQLFSYCQARYGHENVYSHNHYISLPPTEVNDYPEGIIVDSRYLNKKSISNYQHEFNLNEKRREIKLLRPEYLPDVISEWETIKKSNFTRIY